MEYTAAMETTAPVPVVLAELEDLGRYPGWLSMVRRAVPVDPAPGDARPAWAVELRARLGPLARSKRLRMVRNVHEVGHVVFERAELDGSAHSAWVLDVHIGELPGGSAVTVRLHYGGGFGGVVLERLLAEEIERGVPRLRARLEV